MQDGKDVPADKAGQWLREHFEGDPEPEIHITWEVTEPNDLVYREVLSILFDPDPGDQAA